MPCSHCGMSGHNVRTCPATRQMVTRRPITSTSVHTSRTFTFRRGQNVLITDRHTNPSTGVIEFSTYDAIWNAGLCVVRAGCRLNVVSDSLNTVPLFLRLPGGPTITTSFIEDDSSDEDVSPRTPPVRRTPVRRTPPVIKKITPKHIADQVWELNEPDCQICLDKVKKEEYVLSPCGHNFCKKCFGDVRLTKCGECRVDL